MVEEPDLFLGRAFWNPKKEAMDRGWVNAPFFLEFGPKESRHTAFSTERSKY